MANIRMWSVWLWLYNVALRAKMKEDRRATWLGAGVSKLNSFPLISDRTFK